MRAKEREPGLLLDHASPRRCAMSNQAPPESPSRTPEDRPPANGPHDRDVEQQLAERSELRRHYRWLTWMTWCCWSGAVSYALVTLVAVSAVGRADVPVQAGVLVVSLSALVTVAMLMAAVHVLFRPLVWTLIVAGLATVASVVHLVGPNPLGLMFVWSAGWALLFWSILVPMVRLSRLIAAHEDEYILDHTEPQTQRQLKRRSKRERHDRLLDLRRRAAQRAWKVSGTAAAVIVVASAIGTREVLAGVRPPELAPSLAEFEAKWRQSDFASIGRFFPAEFAAQRATWLEGMAEGHGWGRLLPRLESAGKQEQEGSVVVTYRLADLTTLSTRWLLEEREWQLVAWELPDPPVSPRLDSFRQAWQASDPEALAALYPVNYRKSQASNIERSMQLREWTKLPAVIMGEPEQLQPRMLGVDWTAATGPW